MTLTEYSNDQVRGNGQSLLFLFVLSFALPAARAQTGDNVLLVVNRNAAVSAAVADYYRPRRSVPVENICYIETSPVEEISWQVYEEQIERPIGECLKKGELQEKILYIVTTLGVPLKVSGQGGGMTADYASVDSELALLYAKLRGARFQRSGAVTNPFFEKRDAPFRHPTYPIYLVTRLAAWNLNDVKAMIDRSLMARNRGKFVIDLRGPVNDKGNSWLRTAAILLPRDRVTLDETSQILYRQRGVIGYASWGSNDGNRKERWMGFDWLPGAIVVDYVSTNARTLVKPPDNWNWTTGPFEGWQQNLITDYIHEGATGAAGNVYEPYLETIARPDYLLPAWYSGRNLAESYYLSLPALSWQAVILGDPLCSLGKPQAAE
ncbi:MAG TPA: TIGR03790 family protein [Bryobacteraceae bacterium]|nr:TIGR03790 family protein [Bryobacteraceae bacterium]